MVQSLVRAIEMLELLGKGNNKKYSVAEISNDLDLPPSTVHRILKTLHAKGMISKDEDSRLYYLGPALISLGIKAEGFIDVRRVAMPILTELADKTGEDAHIILLSGKKGLFLDKVEGPHPLKIVDTFGPEVDLHCGAIRKCILAYQPNEFIEEYIETGLEQYTERTIVDGDKLKGELLNIRIEGTAVSFAEYVEGSIGIGAPIRDREGCVTAAIGIIGPAARLEENMDSLRNIVRIEANKLSASLGYI